MAQQEADAGLLLWRCTLVDQTEVGTGKARHVEYRAQAGPPDQAAEDLIFRFSRLAILSQFLERVPELQGDRLPKLPPKVTFRSLLRGRLDREFHQERRRLLQRYFDDLADVLTRRYGEVGDPAALCEPLHEFVQEAAARAQEQAQAIARACSVEEDRQLIAAQNAEYEESLRADELRAVAEAERVAEELREAARQEELRREAEAKAAADAAALLRRRAAFEVAVPPAPKDGPHCMVRLRGPGGGSTQRAFLVSEKVATLFEFAAVAKWEEPPAGAFDLCTSLPRRSLLDCQEQTLQEAGLCPSAVLNVVPDEESP